jgi:chemotaxis response regulator CheB
MTIRILIVDDQALPCEGLHTLLRMQPGPEIVGEAANGTGIIQMDGKSEPIFESDSIAIRYRRENGTNVLLGGA